MIHQESRLKSRSHKRARSARDAELHYNALVTNAPDVPSGATHDDTLIEWFLSLEPAERLAELELRLAFFNAIRRDADTQLPADS
jgi:hypothetical protein